MRRKVVIVLKSIEMTVSTFGYLLCDALGVRVDDKKQAGKIGGSSDNH